jgi:dihydroxyacetone kinase
VGEYCTSFDMAGTSLTLFWPDAELEALWDTPVDTPAYRRGSVVQAARADAGADAARDAEALPPSDETSRAVAATVTAAVETIAATIDTHVDELGRLDAIAGDGDHGIGMQRGSHAARDAAIAAREAGAGAHTVLARAADAWSDRAGGTSGALWGLILASLATKLGDEGAPSNSDVAEGVAAGVQSVMTYGKAEVGDKTLVDALVPFSVELSRGIDAGVSLAVAWAAAADAATHSAQSTADLLPRMGRARPHAEKSLGTPDPGAHSLALIATAVAAVLERN